MGLLGLYPNGNYTVAVLSDGTKIRWCQKDQLTPEYPESVDLKICNRCNMGCIMCHECSTPDGECADLNAPVLDSLRPYTELAIGGGNPLEHPGLVEFLKRMKAQKLICNMTVHLTHFMENFGVLKSLTNDQLINGLGISVPGPLMPDEIEAIKSFPNAVVHIIAGMTRPGVISSMENMGLKLLILGYKEYGRGKEHFHYKSSVIGHKIDQLRACLPFMFGKFEAISFDNLAIEQLRVRDLVDEKTWNEQYMGDDGQFTMYIDLVKKEYAISSVSQRHAFTNENIEQLFAAVREEREKNGKQKDERHD